MPDTILISANFKDPHGYFSLTEYLHYTEGQLRQSNQWAEQTRIKESLDFYFPWRKIDTSQVTAIGFVSKQFRFELDRLKILNLLTGHTLYSNSEVVVREIVQNSLDAIRLQNETTGESGEIAIHLDTPRRLLTFDDNGTGMTQQIIEDHFFSIGSSRYQDETFRKLHPDFSAISRFGIGILTIFMVSDEIEVMTKPAEESEVRNISIRSLSGKYLIRILHPGDSKVPGLIRSHGTRVQLKLRPGVDVPDVQKIADFWIQFPGCKVSVKIDENPPVSIGHSSPRQLLEEWLSNAGCELANGEPGVRSSVYRVDEKAKGDLVLAYALRWQPYYSNWGFAMIGDIGLSGPTVLPVAVCVQGVKVQATSPGFSTPSMLAISNISGKSSPATNVSRSSLEPGQRADEMFDAIYHIYLDHVAQEIEQMVRDRNQSPTQAVSEGRFLLQPLHGDLASGQCSKADVLFRSRLKEVPLVTLDSREERVSVSIERLRNTGGFWTIESRAQRSAEDFLRRVPTNASLFQLASISGFAPLTEKDNLLGGYADNRRVRDLILSEFEVDRIELREGESQANLHWRPRTGTPIWQGILPKKEEKRQKVEQLMQVTGRYAVSHGIRYRAMVLQISDELEITGSGGACGLTGVAQTYVFKGNTLHRLLLESYQSLEAGNMSEAEFAFVLVVVNLFKAEEWPISPNNRVRLFKQFKQQISQHANAEIGIPADLEEAVEDEKLRLFDAMRGDRLSLWQYSGMDYFD